MTRRPIAAGGSGRATTRRAVLGDLTNAVLVAALGVVLIAVGGTGPARLPQVFEPATHWWHLAPLAVACAAIAVQSRWPVPAFAVATAALVVDGAMGLRLALVIAWSTPLYAVGRFAQAPVRRGISIGVVIATLFTAPAIVALGGDGAAAIATTLQVGAVVAIALWWSAEVRAGHEAAEAERRRAADAARLAELERAEALRAERGAMARDLHDLISSRLSAIAIQATAALQLAPDAERDRRVVGEVRRESVAALDDMRDLIRLLRSPGDEHDDLAIGGLETLGDVVSRFRAAGLDLAEAETPAAIEGLDREAERTLVLVAREALTNALKHGAGSATLRLTAGTDRARLEIENPTIAEHAAGEAASDDVRRGLGAGIGLEAMRERLAAVGGTLEAGKVAAATTGETPGGEGGIGGEGGQGGEGSDIAERWAWRLAATVPRSASPAHEGATT